MPCPSSCDAMRSRTFAPRRLAPSASRRSSRKEGLATTLLSPILNEADRLGIACCLETSTVKNRRFYERRGFTQATEIVLPGGPDTWWLHRAPRAAQAGHRDPDPGKYSPGA